MTPRHIIRGGRWRAVWLLVAVAMIAWGGVGWAAAQTSEDAHIVAALKVDDAYASPTAYGPGVAQQVHADAVALANRGEQVKLAAVPSIGGRDISAYAAQLRSALKYSGTVVVTTLEGAIGAAGPRSVLSIQNAILAVGAAEVADPAARLLVAAEVSTPPPSDSGSGIRDLVLLVGLALLGAAFAIGWGLRGEERRAHARAMEARGILKVYADALGARAALLAERTHQTPEARALVEAVDAYHVAAEALVDHALTETDLLEGAVSVRSGLWDAERAGLLLGVDFPAAEPFVDLCSVDPRHGPRVDADVAGPLCAACTERRKAGYALEPRRVLVGGHPVSYRDAPVPYDVTTPPVDSAV